MRNRASRSYKAKAMRSKDLTCRKGDAERVLWVRVISSCDSGGEKNMVLATFRRVKVHRSGVGASILAFRALPISGKALSVSCRTSTGWRGLVTLALALSTRAFPSRSRRLLGKKSVRRNPELPSGQLCSVILVVTVTPAVLPDRRRSEG